MRKLLIGTTLVLLATTSSPAFARYGFCTVSINGAPQLSNGLYPQRFSGVIDTGDRADKSDDEVAQRYREIKDAYGAEFRQRADCDTSYRTEREAEEMRQSYFAAMEGKSEDTGWVGNYAPSGIEKPKISGPFLRVIDVGAQEKARTEAWENLVLQGAREDAQRKAYWAAKSAEYDAESARLQAEVTARWKRKGRSQ